MKITIALIVGGWLLWKWAMHLMGTLPPDERAKLNWDDEFGMCTDEELAEIERLRVKHKESKA